MTLNQFRDASELEQIRIVNIYGVLLAERTIGYNRVYLYAINSFYVEVFHELYKTGKTSLSIFRSFEDVRFLEEYLGNIEIPQFK